MKKEDGKLRVKYCGNSRCDLYQRDFSKDNETYLTDAMQLMVVLYCPCCGVRLSSNERQ